MMNPQAELDRLLADTFDQPPDEARNQKLRDLLKAHPELQEQYVAQMQLHALLQWRGGKAAPVPTEQAIPATTHGWSSRAGLAAALMFMAASIALVVFFFLPEGQAGPDQLVDLIDWNLELAKTPRLEERDLIYAGRIDNLKVKLAAVQMSENDRVLADTLFENSDWLKKNDDPLATAQRFNVIADKLVERFDAMAATRDVDRVAKFADAYSRLAEQGVDANQKQAQASGKLDGDRKLKLAQIEFNEETRAKKLEQMIERHPEPLRKALRRGMKGHPLKGKK